ncbi:hypothetical protein [Rickettsia endosymbiont of Halotydeus destructor]|uniref:hypothetical protein n=1 Tax=Rickettsia endosymbiont of Halotydeus destructor TaxID=2996754 RepID=UPI003BAF7204
MLDNKNIAKIEGQIQDIKNLPGRINTLIKNTEFINDLIEKHIRSNDYIISTIEGLGASTINKILSNDKIQKLVNNINNSLEQSIKLEVNEEEKGKLKLNLSKTEAALKGFILPLSAGGPYDDLGYEGVVDKAEILSIPVAAVKKALVEVNGKNIPKDQYAKEIIKIAMKILKDNKPAFSLEKLAEYEKYITLGDKSKKSKLNTDEIPLEKLEELRKAVTKTTDQIIEKLNINKEIGKTLEQCVTIINKSKIDNKKVTKTLMPVLATLDTAYLSENNAVIAKELKTVNAQGTSRWEKFKSIFTRKDYLAEKLAKIASEHVLKSDKYAETEINDKIFSNAISEKQLGVGLSKFIEQNKDKLKDLEIITSKPSKEINSKERAELRKVNPVGFDKVLFSPPSHKQEEAVKKTGEIPISHPSITPNTKGTTGNNRERG